MPDRPPHYTDVLIVGAGPAGLMLAAELANSGCIPTVVDSLSDPTGQSRALGFTVRTVEILQQRGLLDRFDGLAQQDGVHFGGLLIPGGALSSSFRPANQYPQSKTEEVLANRVAELGVSTFRTWTLQDLVQDDGLVKCRLESAEGESAVVQARYVVGCDGAHSTVRAGVGATMDRTPPAVQMLLADVRDCGLPDNPFGVKHPHGMAMSAPLGDGTERVIVCQFNAPVLRTGRPVTFADVQKAYQTVVGDRLRDDGECLWASSFTDASALVHSYGHGNVLLVGDSAHTHLPAGGQGMNVSIQDAVNLGWKLAATVQGWAPPELLDTYDSERRPVGAQLIANTKAQGQLFLRGPEVDPLRDVMARLLAIPAAAALLADSVSGLDVVYDMGASDPSPLLGRRLPPGLLRVRGTTRDAVTELRTGQAVMFLLDHSPGLADTAARWTSRVRLVDADLAEPVADLAAVHGLLVRPDGHIAWVADQSGQSLCGALRRWLGVPTTTVLQEV